MFRSKSNFRCPNGHVRSFMVTECKPVEEYVNGVLVKRVVTIERDALDLATMPDMPTAQEMSLENLQEAGIPLKEIKISGVLNPTDPEVQTRIAQSGLMDVANVMSGQYQPEPEPIAEPQPNPEPNN